ncbi:hypothetical protein ScPMuIL_005686 [Solemya velum]
MVKTKIRDRVNKSNHSMNPDRPKGQGGHNMRDKATINRLKMYKNFKPKRDKVGKIVKAAPFQNTLKPGAVARVEPNRKWFGNTRVITQSALQTFQDEMKKVKNDPYKVVMRQTRLPVSLLNEKAKQARMHILDTETFESTFGKKSHRKRPKIQVVDVQALVDKANVQAEKYVADNDGALVREDTGVKDEQLELIFKAGQSRRVWNELYKVIDSSDVVVQVLDARDPVGTRCPQIEKYLKDEKPHKHLIFVLNKVDLVPTWATQKWVAILSPEYPTMAFHASITNPFGKGALINLLRQFGKLHLDKKQISVGFIGYPNVGKSSIINTLRSKKVCKVAPIAGETKVWQYITLMRRIYLVDCPGVVYPTGSTPTQCVLKGVVRVEYLKTPEEYIPAMLDRVKEEYVKKTYKIDQWTDFEDFLDKLGKKWGKLLKGGEPDRSTVAKMILNDWQRGKIPYFVRPPESEQDKQIANIQIEQTINEVVATSGQEQSTPSVSQDYSKIPVDAEFSGEDVRDLEPGCDKDDSDDGEESEEENSGEPTTEIKVSDNAPATFVRRGKMPEKTSNKHSQNESIDGESKLDSSKTLSTSERHSKAQLSKKQTPQTKAEKKRKRKLKKSSIGGGYVQDDIGSKVGASGDATTEAFHVDSKPMIVSLAEKKISQSKTKKRKVSEDVDADASPRLSSKQRRKAERENKQKKIGTHFYATANVKNRSYRT